jgi:hypothetical protein
MHRAAPSEPHVETALGQEPEALLRAVVSGFIGIEQERHLATGQALGPTFNFRQLLSTVILFDMIARPRTAIQPNPMTLFPRRGFRRNINGSLTDH